MTDPTPLSPACVNTEAVTDPALPRPMSEDYQAPSGAGRPITPPPELVQQLRREAPHGIRDAGVTRELHLIAAAYRAGADHELEACCEALARELICDGKYVATDLRSVRRPKPPSLKEQALKALDSFEGFTGSLEEVDTIRRALEQLND